MNILTDAAAISVIEIIRQVALGDGIAVTIAICDGGGHLLALSRMDGALLASIDVAQVKAKTAVFFGTETRNLPFDKPFTPALLGAASYPIAFLPGGIPIRVEGKIIGAIGVGGSTAELDHAYAEIGAREWGASK
ncbi:glc operon protein GlcG [Undibacterium sp. GrIS 1.8]|uniref:GlcG/HbpS family heme-binding protein n=1 Tax=Undibacterium sp. GrIS 1.8 TaxID=3143934 RepID=UPI0033949F26